MPDIEEQINNYYYNDYYKKSTDWDAYYEHLAEEEDMYYEELNSL